jgi:hypothetical protein
MQPGNWTTGRGLHLGHWTAGRGLHLGHWTASREGLAAWTLDSKQGGACSLDQWEAGFARVWLCWEEGSAGEKALLGRIAVDVAGPA